MKNTNLIIILAFVFILMLLTSCAQTQVTDTGVTIKSTVDPHVYQLTFAVNDDIINYSATSSKATYYDGLVSYSSWQDGKGLIRGTIKSIHPSHPNFPPESMAIIKTSDRKAMAAQPGDVIIFACTVDWEPVCAKSTVKSRIGDCVDTVELDYCRMIGMNDRRTK